MADKVKPLKMENASLGGTQNDPFPTEANPAQDYITGFGFSFQNSDTLYIDANDGTNIRFRDGAITTGITLSELRFAKGLNTLTGNVDSSGAAAPSAGQILTATSATAANWQSVFTLFTSGEITDAASANITTTDAQISTMTVTPVAGTYLLWFVADFSSATSGIVVTVKFRVAGVDDVQFKVMPFAGGTLTAGSQRVTGSLVARVTVNGSQAIQVFGSTSSGTVACANKNFCYLRVA